MQFKKKPSKRKVVVWIATAVGAAVAAGIKYWLL